MSTLINETAIEFTFNDLMLELKEVHPRERIAIAYKYEEFLETLSSRELDKVGYLLCNASSRLRKESHPVKDETHFQEGVLTKGLMNG